VFSLDSVFTAIGLANRIEVMVAAIVVSLPVMMGISSALARFIDRYPSVKALALAFLVLVGVSLIGESLHLEIPRSYLFFAMAFAAAVQGISIRLRRRG
jgi:predicted tellurium resistance membrane protein TerC